MNRSVNNTANLNMASRDAFSSGPGFSVPDRSMVLTQQGLEYENSVDSKTISKQ